MDRHVNFASAEIHRLFRSVQPQIHPWIDSSERSRTGHKPARRECARRRERYDAARPSCLQICDRLGKCVEAIAQNWVETLPLYSQQQLPRSSIEERQTNPILEQPNLMADRGWRNRKFGGGVFEAQVPRRSLKGAQGS